MDPFSPLAVGDLALPNRIVMAPMTRLRADERGVPGALIAEYYAQRAGTGLIISEGVFPSAESKGYPGQPGIATDEQAEGWRVVAEAVHAAGGRIVMQIMNAGRVSHPAITGTDRIVAPSALAIDGEVRTPNGADRFPVPHALSADELATVRDEFVAAARRALDAGVDGVEVHSANGYLLHEFLSPVSNVRTDAYGGSPAARAAFPLEVTRAIVDEVGAGRVGIRLSPSHNIQDVLETDADDVRATYEALVDGLAPLGLAYLSVLHAEPTGGLVQDLRARFHGVFVANSGFSSPTTREEAIALIAEGHADAVAVGRPLIANPDLVERWQGGHSENEVDQATVYAGGAKGYTDYEPLSA
ncbi:MULTISPECIES: alkene reductase [unclassified Rathayibacter]|uniref:alkene reductase n=1 Tax=unclassified Rathayibacter TaxID=2609250 RepID=UPI00188B4A41|nr:MULTISPECIES: alkene reductase [unclassified Rathayibacter]MBF4461508.1 alkene reductase [Rathayibacter sp. VKM Ac-2879]MBF4502919.1 alkene reductase [Rathayibacter sp. VKM Ac-2878]